jgi:fermentation-respiration switch protein FrsA (DUF1100 family)
MTLAALALLALSVIGYTPTIQTVMVHGKPQTLHVYGSPGGPTAIVSSGDGGWIHLAPHIATFLAARGWFVVGFDSRAYLRSVSDGARALTINDVASDYATLVSAAGGHAVTPVLVGVSEGAGLSAAAAADPVLKRNIRGVVTIGLGDRNELAWHLRDTVIYFTKGVPNEPLFHAADVVGAVTPTPIAMVRSTHDEFVPPEESDRLMRAARDPKALWTVTADDHRFSNNLKEFDTQLLQAITWIASAPR